MLKSSQRLLKGPQIEITVRQDKLNFKVNASGDSLIQKVKLYTHACSIIKAYHLY